MTIFRSSAMVIGLLVAACSVSKAGKPNPGPATPSGKIFQISKFADRAAALKQFAEARLGDRDGLRAQLLAAGFVEGAYRDYKGVDCQGFDWTDDGGWPVVVRVNICGDEVFATAGQIAP